MDKLIHHYHKLRDITEEGAPNIFMPLSFQINLTNACYQRCIGCRKYEWPNYTLPLERVLNVIDFLRNNCGRSVVLSGGDPTKYKDLDEVLEACQYASLDVGVLTAAVWPSTFNAEKLATIPSWIAVSIDGGTESTYARCRGVPTYIKAIENIKRLKKINPGVKIRINSTISNYNIHEMDLILELGQRLDVDVYFFPIHTWDDLKVQNVNTQIVVEQVNNCFNIYEGKIKTNFQEFMSLLHREKPNVCIVPYIHAFIDSDGEVFPCCRVADDNGYFKDREVEFSMGNILKDNMYDIWYSEKADFVRTALYNPCLSVCEQCDRYNKINANYYSYLQDQKFFI